MGLLVLGLELLCFFSFFGVVISQLLHHSSSPYGPWIPVIPDGCNGSTGIWRDGGGNNQSPFYITEAVASITGLPKDSIIAITTYHNNITDASSNFAVGIAQTWRDPMVINKRALFELPPVTVWEDPYIYFDLQRKVWRVLYHEVPGKAPLGHIPMPNIHKHCGGYAESVTPNIWGEWKLSPPQCGAYTLDVDDFVGLGPAAPAASVVSTASYGNSSHDLGTQLCGKATIHHTRGCFNNTGWAPNKSGLVLPTYVSALDRAQLTLESCAEACGNLPAHLPVAGVGGGARCFCGTAADLGTRTASELERPKSECATTPCGGNQAEKECGGVERLLAFDYTCSHSPPHPSPPRPPPPPPPPMANCTEASFEAMCDSFDNPGDCHWCSPSGVTGQCINKGVACPTPPCTAAPPFKFGESYPAYANASMTSWGGNAVVGDDGKYHLYTSAMSYGKNNNALMSDLIPGPCSVGTWVRNSLVIHAVASAPTGPFSMTDIALPSVHTNPQIMRTPDGEWLLYSQAVCSSNQYDPAKGCVGCHKGQCGPQVCDRPAPFPPLPAGMISFSRRERPKMLFDKEGRPTHLFNSADPGASCTPPNPGWEGNSRPFTMITEILES
jgi:hypothetical protein